MAQQEPGLGVLRAPERAAQLGHLGVQERVAWQALAELPGARAWVVVQEWAESVEPAALEGALALQVLVVELAAPALGEVADPQVPQSTARKANPATA